VTHPWSDLCNALPIPVLLIGADQRVALVNPLAQALFSVQVTGLHYITALRQPSVLDAIEAVLGGAGRRTTGFLGGEGPRANVWRVTVTPLGPEVLVAFEDVTAVEEADEMRRDFVANVSHELRTPLTALQGFIETLTGAARDDPAARDRFLAIMANETGRMVRLVNDLLSLGRVEAAERVRPTDMVDLNALVAAIPHAFAPGQSERIRVQRPGTATQVPGDEGQLRQVLMNLVENSLKYGRPGSPVTLSLTGPVHEDVLRGPGVRLTVTDEGDGIAAHHIPRLTQRFYRVDTHRSRAVGGTGLGLAIVKHIVNRHRGRLRIDSRQGEGSSFAVILPVE
jgi:two-component system, OmpR family, phosphate regulon sensor histidine kinase PhoR